MTLSVIIPVYCVEATLDRCVESVLRQHVDDMEVILVDDGSPDHCPEMCDQWAAKDQRIRVIHKANGGLSDARNAGIDIACGDYITFVDSDDWIAADTYRPLLEKMAGIDILEYAIADRLSLNDHIYDDINKYWLNERVYTHTYAWNKIYRRQLFDDVRYPKGRIFEDIYTLPQLLRKAQRIATSSHGSYHYWTNPTGITATADGNALTQLLEAHHRSQMPIDDLYYMYLVNIQIDVWERTGNDMVLPKRKVRIGAIPSQYKFKARILNSLGLKALCIFSKLLHHFKKPSQL